MTEQQADDKSDHITVYRAVGGWQSVYVTWEWRDDNKDLGFWEPWQTGMGPYVTIQEAINDAKSWAESEEVRYVPNENERVEKLGEWLRSKEFYELMYVYRTAPLGPQEIVVAAFGQVQEAIARKVLEVYEPTKCIAERPEPKEADDEG